MTCKDIEQFLPAYLEDSLSPEEKILTEEHLASCRQCGKALEDLKKTEKFVRELEEVEPPPWFTQKIMSRVREEAKREKGIIRKLFYPLHIKIPLQALATVLIAVLAVQVYRTGEPEMKAVITPPAAFLEAGKEQVPVAAQKSPPPMPDRPAKEKPQLMGDEKKAKGEIFAPAPVITDKTGERKEQRIREEREALTEKAADLVRKREAAKDEMIEYKRTVRMYDAAAPAGKVKEHETAPPVMGTAIMEKPARIAVTVHAGDVNTAAGEVETLLGKFGAWNVKRRHLEGREVLTAELQVKNVRELMEKIKAIGETKVARMPSDIRERDVSIIIEVSRNHR